MEEVLHSCGHRELVDLEAAGRSRDRKRGYLERSGRCHPCTEIQLGALNRAAARKADEDGLPRLEGTEIQVAAATSVRERFRLQFEMAAAEAHRVGAPLSGVALFRACVERQIRSIRTASTYLDLRRRDWLDLLQDCQANASEAQENVESAALLEALRALVAARVGFKLRLVEEGWLVLVQDGNANPGGDVHVAQ